MARIIAIDYGSKRVGLAVTDESQIIATALDVVHSMDVIEFLKKYIAKEKVEAFVVGEAVNLDGSDTHSTPLIKAFINALKKNFPDLPVEMEDESFTSKMAMDTMIQSGIGKHKRRDKKLVDKISAVLILQAYLERKAGT